MDKNRRHRKSRNLFQRLSIGFFSIITCMSVIITGSFSVYYKQQADESVYESIQQISEINAQSISNTFGQMELAIKIMNSEPSGIHEKLMLYTENGDVRTLVQSFQQTQELISNYISIALRSFSTNYHAFFFLDSSYDIYEELSSVDVHATKTDGQTWVYSDKTVQEEEWFQLALAQPNQSHWLTMDNEQNILYMTQGLEYLSIRNDKVVTTSLGVILVKLDSSWIEESVTMSGLASNTVFLLTDKNGQILYTSNPKVSGMAEDAKFLTELSTGQLLNLNQGKYTTEVTSVTNGLNLVTLIPIVELSKNYVRILMPFLLLLFATLLIGGSFSIFFSHRMTRDILHLARHMRGELLRPVKFQHSLQDEDINVLYDSYNTLVFKVHESIQKQAKHLDEKREMELNLMQAQINPHFLCNSLNSVYNVAVLHKEDSIAKAVSGLCAFLRYNVSAPNIEVPLQRELDMLEHYILLQNFLCGDRIFFDYKLNVDPEQTKISKMLLQPLLENCIMHNNGSEFIEIMLSSEVREDKFVLVVEDNGTGEHIEEINQALRSACDQNSKSSTSSESGKNGESSKNTPELNTHGYGIHNVHQRIKIRYGERYGLYYTKARDGGVAACVELPVDIVVQKDNFFY